MCISCNPMSLLISKGGLFSDFGGFCLSMFLSMSESLQFDSLWDLDDSGSSRLSQSPLLTSTRKQRESKLISFVSKFTIHKDLALVLTFIADKIYQLYHHGQSEYDNRKCNRICHHQTVFDLSCIELCCILKNWLSVVELDYGFACDIWL